MGAAETETAIPVGVASAFSWVDAILAGDNPSNRWIRLACERHVRDMARADDPAFPYTFDAKRAERAIRFIELMPHTKGRWAAKRERLILDPWQRFFVASVFGWVHKATGLRRFRVADLYVPRKNGKSALAAGIGNYMLAADGEFGAEVYSGATTQKQAWEVFRPALQMAQRTPAFRRQYGVTTSAAKIECPKTGSRFEPVIGKPGDGASPSLGICDEYHEHADDSLYDTLLTGMGARDQPLMLVITTAGDDIAGPCYAHLDELKATLSGTVEDDQLFGLLFTIDDDDDWTDEAALIKANPNFDVSVSRDFLVSEQAKARRNARHQARFKTKHLNIWVSDRAAYYNMDLWQRQTIADLGELDLTGCDQWGALDLASKHDMTAYVRVWRKIIDGQAHFYVVKPRFYLPDATAFSPDKKHYHAWADGAHLTVTDGDIIDFKAIRDDIVDDITEAPIQGIGFDPWGATQFAQEMQDEHGVNMVRIDQRTSNLSEPMKWIDAFLRAGRLHHDGNPVLSWMISNVVAKADANDNVFPRRSSDEKKIDGAVALIMALGMALADTRAENSYLEDDELMVL